MKRSINLKLDDPFFEELKAYAQANGSSLTSMVRGMVTTSFFEALSSDRSELKRLENMMEQADNYQLSNREKADLEMRISMLKAKNERFNETFNDLAAELYGTQEDENA